MSILVKYYDVPQIRVRLRWLMIEVYKWSQQKFEFALPIYFSIDKNYNNNKRLVPLECCLISLWKSKSQVDLINTRSKETLTSYKRDFIYYILNPWTTRNESKLKKKNLEI